MKDKNGNEVSVGDEVYYNDTEVHHKEGKGKIVEIEEIINTEIAKILVDNDLKLSFFSREIELIEDDNELEENEEEITTTDMCGNTVKVGNPIYYDDGWLQGEAKVKYIDGDGDVYVDIGDVTDFIFYPNQIELIEEADEKLEDNKEKLIVRHPSEDEYMLLEDYIEDDEEEFIPTEEKECNCMELSNYEKDADTYTYFYKGKVCKVLLKTDYDYYNCNTVIKWVNEDGHIEYKLIDEDDLMQIDENAEDLKMDERIIITKDNIIGNIVYFNDEQVALVDDENNIHLVGKVDVMGKVIKEVY